MARFLKAVSCVALAFVITACGRSDGSKPASQVAVKVNGEEISVHQMNNLLRRLGPVAQAQADGARAQVLERLIDQELMLQKASEVKLDRDANVLAAIDGARRQILSQAYMERVAAAVPQPTPEEMRDYYSKHPELFAKRRVYRFQEIAAAVNEEQRKRLEEQVKKTRNFNQLAGWLREQKIPFSADFALKAAEQLPLGALPRLHAMKQGDIEVFPGPDRVLIVQLVAAQDAPLSEKEAEPFIARFLAGQKRAEAASNEMKQLRASAKIEYVGDFDKQAAAKPAETVKAKVEKKGGSNTESGDIGKALSGLK